MLRAIKLYFTDRSYYKQWKRYSKRQKAARKTMRAHADKFCPWSGWYMHEMIKYMLQFYTETYERGDCCWRESDSRLKLAESMRQALGYAEKLESMESMSAKDILATAKKDKIAFINYVKAWEAKVDLKIEDSNHADALMESLAEEYLTDKYTKAMYKIIGEHIWEWCD